MTDSHSPAEILKGIHEDRAELLRLGVEFNKERRELGKKEFEFEKRRADALVTYEVNWRQLNPSEKRLPAEDMRKAHSLGMIGKVWQDFLEAQATVEALDKLIRIRQAHLSSLQSELNYLTEELRNSS
jgi:hypothetical protein